MQNPFEQLMSKRLPEGEEVEGAFSCQERGCYSTVATAKLFSENELLTWLCENEHVNKIEGFKIDG